MGGSKTTLGGPSDPVTHPRDRRKPNLSEGQTGAVVTHSPSRCSTGSERNPVLTHQPLFILSSAILLKTVLVVGLGALLPG